ncbi:hypothetical protein ACFV2U_32695 [Streptomyces sp. NPDC059697]|uniref:hypothetical protein n=1 Tax=Streptomyces sp. NPDC059697 TaxID=3346912 RepID=UPI0036A63AF4
MNATFAQRCDDSTVPSGGGLAARIAGVAGAGAALTYLSFGLVEWADRYNTRTCAEAPDFCMTLWPVLSFPAAFVIALVGLIVVYRLLGIRPGLAVIPPTLLLAPFPLTAALSTAGLWPATVVGAVWTTALALTVWRPYRILGLSTAATLLLASLIVIYR